MGTLFFAPSPAQSFTTSFLAGEVPHGTVFFFLLRGSFRFAHVSTCRESENGPGGRSCLAQPGSRGLLSTRGGSEHRAGGFGSGRPCLLEDILCFFRF